MLVVPKELREQLGRSKFVKSLETTEESTARLKAGQVILEWKGLIARARTGEVLTWDDQAQAPKVPPPGSPPPDSTKDVPIDIALKEFVRTMEAKAKARYIQGNRLQWLHDTFKTFGQLTSRRLIEELRKANRSRKVAKLNVAIIQRYIAYLKHRKLLAQDYHLNGELTTYDYADFPVRGSARHSYDIWTVGELGHLYQASLTYGRNPERLSRFIVIGAYSGLRIGEIANLKAQDCKNRVFKIIESKTIAGIREVPIHSAIQPLIDQLCKDAGKDGRLWPDLVFYENSSKGGTISLQFLRLREKLGYSGFREKVFHSIRKTLVTALENAGVPENVAADIVGHEKTTLTYGLYSGGTSMKQKREALELVQYDWYPPKA